MHRISDDVKTIARDELELVREDVKHHARAVSVDAAAILLGAIVVLIGLAMLCVAAVSALAPVIASLTLRLVLVAFVYMVVGGGIAAGFRARLRGDTKSHAAVLKYEAKRTVSGIADSLSSAEGASHA